MARPESEPKTALAARLRALRKEVGDPERDEVAAQIGVGKSTLASYERGETEPSASALSAYRSVYGANVLWIVTGEGPMFDEAKPSVNRPVQVPEDVLQRIADRLDEIEVGVKPKYRSPRFEPRPPATIKYYNVRLSAGGGATALYESPGSDFSLEEMASELLGIPIAHVRIFPIRGDSMFPTLADGDLAVLDSRENDPIEGKMYAFAANGDTYVKRAEWIDEAHLKWNSDNPDPRYAPMTVDGDELRTMRVFGRVVWVWKAV